MSTPPADRDEVIQLGTQTAPRHSSVPPESNERPLTLSSVMAVSIVCSAICSGIVSVLISASADPKIETLHARIDALKASQEGVAGVVLNLVHTPRPEWSKGMRDEAVDTMYLSTPIIEAGR